MCDMVAIRKIANKYKLKIIEDCAHCIEGMRDENKPGELSDTACFSFFATKNITSGEGGAISTDSKEIFDRLKLLRLHGMTKTSLDRFKEGYQHWDMVSMGWKYNLDNIQAALLIPQMRRISKNLIIRERLAKIYNKMLEANDDIKIPSSRKNVIHARHLYTVWVNKDLRDKYIKYLFDSGIMTVVNYRPIHLLSFFSERFNYKLGDFPNAEKIGSETISLPFYPSMPENDIGIVVKTINLFGK